MVCVLSINLLVYKAEKKLARSTFFSKHEVRFKFEFANFHRQIGLKKTKIEGFLFIDSFDCLFLDPLTMQDKPYEL